MAWTAPMTAVANDIWTAAQFNVHVRDNLLETAPAQAPGTVGLFVASDTNELNHMASSVTSVTTSETLAVTGSAQDLATSGPQKVQDVGASQSVTIMYCAEASHSSANTTAGFGVEVSKSGSGVVVPLVPYDSGVWFDGSPANQASRFYGVQRFTADDLDGAGTYTFKMRYFITAATATYSNRHITLLPF